ncbi:uncharacterized protein [Dendrobates tinctorius]|uniref:uncharacterized protein n=1 Tax=Dendrobates tinctorius TaxID=92724 RepID=UPI003CC92B9D
MAGHDLEPVGPAHYTIWAETGVRAPPQHALRITPAQSPSLQKVLLLQIEALLPEGVVSYVPPQEAGRGHYSRLCLIKKPSGKHRLIIDLKPLNHFIKYRRFKMESVKSAIPLIGRGWQMATIDLRDAYYHVPIHPDHRKFLRFDLPRPRNQPPPVQCPAVWCIPSTKGVHEDHEGSSHLHSASGDMHCAVSRRSADRRPIGNPTEPGRIKKPTDTRNPRVETESPEVGPLSFPEEKIPGDPLGFRKEDFLSSRRSSKRPSAENNPVQRPKGTDADGHHVHPGFPDSVHSGGILGTSSHASPPVIHPDKREEAPKQPIKECSTSRTCKIDHLMVAELPKPEARSKLRSASSKNIMYRCQSERLGSRGRGFILPGEVAPEHKIRIFDPKGVDGGGRVTEGRINPYQEPSCSDIL